ncbi:MAG: exodeoxyribonuclease VII small subunit [Bacteroidetes bacterium]|nr:exodeoxyribonuclease VII small subunit [Bacteroidota bacterium]
MTKKKFNYNQAIEEINSTLTKIENSEPDVDELSELVNYALNLINQCKQKLHETEEKLNADFDNTGNPTGADI